MALVSHPVKEEMFLTTPVENLFIHEAMGTAPGDYVKVYLYGLMLCHYPPREDAGIRGMAEALGLSEEEIRQAFAYWSRRRLVQILSEEPLEISYLSVQQHLNEARLMDDLYRYEGLFRQITTLLGPDVSLSRRDLEQIYEWMEDLHMEEEAVLALVEHCVLACREKGRPTGMKYMHAVATEWSRKGLTTAAEIAEYLRQEDEAFRLCQQLLRRWGISRQATDDDRRHCQKWLGSWSMEPGAVMIACQRMQAAKPNFRYLDTLMQELHENGVHTAQEADAYYAARDSFMEELRAVVKALGYLGSVQAELPQSFYRAWKDAGYPHDAILAAARQLSRRGINRLEDLDNRLRTLASQGRLSAENIAREDAALRSWSAGFASLLPLWEEDRPVRDAESRRYGRWLQEGHSPELIRAAAEAARFAREKISYMERLLSDWKKEGIVTAEAAAHASAARRAQASAAAPASAAPGLHFGHERAAEPESDPYTDWDAPL